MSENLKLKVARPEDAEKLVSIYAPYILETAVTCEYVVPDTAAFQKRIEHTLEKYPYLTVWNKEEIIGYAYAGTFIARTACDWTAEASIYLQRDKRGNGAGRLLYETLEKILMRQNIANMTACIAKPAGENPYVTDASIQFHTHMGFHLVGEFHHSCFKFQHWYNLVWMEKQLLPHGVPMKPVRWFPEIRKEICRELQIQDTE